TASDRSGAIAKGSLEAKNPADATRQLGKMGLFVLEVKPSANGNKRPSPIENRARPSKPAAVLPTVVTHPTKPPPRPVETEKVESRSGFWGVSLPPLQRALYLRQLYAMFEAGIPLHKATELLAENPEHSTELQARLREIPRDLEKGRPLSKSLERSRLFSRLIVSSVKVGEHSGGLARVLSSLSDAEEKSVRLKKVLISKLTYPAIVMLVMCLGLLILGHVMSRVMASVPGFDPEAIPLFGFLTTTFRHPAFLPACLLLVVAFGGLCWKTYRTPSWRLMLESYLLHVPVLGKLLARLESNTVTTQLSLLLKAGLTLDRALELCSDLVSTEVFREALKQSKKEIRNGITITESFEMSALFPADVVAMIAAGETAGALEKSMAKAADYCTDQVERTLETALSLLEPLLIGVLGIAIGGVILCTFVPVFNQIQTM
ncbi:MAG: type II secretion system F family protein, partial [Vulcanimicrobiota bacterium]